MLTRYLLVLAAVGMVTPSASAGLFSRGCGDSGCTTKSCCPGDYCCKPEYKTEDVKRHCYETECKAVVIPPVKLPCCKCAFKGLFKRGCGSSCGGCSDGGCGTCGSGCGDCGPCHQDNCCKNGLLSRLCSKLTACRVRCVNTYSKKEYKCGTKCKVSWEANPAGCGNGGCGSGGCGQGAYCNPECCAPAGCQ